MSRADIVAGRAHVSLYMKQDQLTRGIAQARANVSKFGSEMMAIGAKLVAATAAIGAPVAFATRTFADFDDAMRAVGAVSRATAAELLSMTNVAKELGRTTSFTAVEVAKLMTELGRAGFSPDQVNAMTGAVLDLARATGTDATLASGIMAASIRQFGLEATDAARVADVLTMAANSTFNTVEGLGESLKYAGPVAKELGMSLEDTVAILGSLGNVGIQGSEAGSALRRLGVISAATGEKLKKIFNISNVDATGKLKPLVQIMDEIGKKIKELPVADRVAKMNEAFGLLGITSASVLAGTAEGTAKLAEELRNAEGSASKAAKSMDSGLGGSFRIIMSAAEGLSIAIGEALAGSIKSVTETITGLIGQATTWAGANQGVIVSAASIAAAVGAAGVAMVSFGLAAKAVAAGMGALSAVVTAVKIGIGAAAAITQVFGAVSVATGTAMYVLSSGIALVNGVATLSTVIAGGMAAAWSTASAIVSAAWAVMTAPILPFIIAGAAVVAIIAGVAAAAAWAAVKAADFSGAWKVVTTTLGEVMAIAKRVGGILMDALGGGDYDIAMGVAFAGVKIALAKAIDGMSELWSMFWNGAWNMTKSFFSNFVSITYKIVKAIAKAIANPLQAASEIKGALTDIMSGKISIGIDTEGMKKNATAEIEKLEKELDARKAKREAEQKAKDAAEQKKLESDAKSTASPTGAIGDGTPSGSATQEQMDAPEEAVASASAFDRETEALERQIIALREGEEAAERFRLAKQGLTDEQIEQVMNLKKEEEALKKQEEAGKRVVNWIQEYADADYEKNKLTPAEIAAKEKQSIEAEMRAGKISQKTAAEAMAEADIRQAEKEHKERLKKFKGEGQADGSVSGMGVGLKSGAASAATFSAQSLLAMGGGAGQSPQVRALLETKKILADQLKAQKEQSDAQIAAIEKQGLHHA
jgi:TP901 family phage tail tape measure protein